MARILAASLLLAASGAVADEAVPLYTNDDLDRMFGKPPAAVTEPVDKSGPQDWMWVQDYLDRQYARLDADREYELKRRVVDIADERTDVGYGDRYGYGYYGGYAAFGLRYPASVWYNNVSRSYRSGGASIQPKPKMKPAPRGRRR